MNKRFPTMTVAVLAVAALALTPVAAQAAAPELGRCVKVAKGKGRYKDAGCEKGEVTAGNYEWQPGAGLHNKFTSTEGPSEIQTAGTLDLECASAVDTGEYTGPKTDTETITFSGCSSRGPCQNGASGEIKTKVLTSTFGFIAAPKEVGVSLEGPGGIFAEFECRNFKATISGSVIARITPISKMTLSFKEKFRGRIKQQPEKFEGEPKDTLLCPEAKDFGPPIEQCGLTSTDTVTNEEKLEINEVL
jgi:hypothetical protein